MLSLFALAILATSTDGTVATDAEEKVVLAVVRNAVDEVLSVLKEKELSLKEKRKRVTEIMDPLVDFKLMAKLSLGRKQWTKIEPKQRESFTELFVETLRWLYFEKLDLFTDEIVEFEKPVAKRTKFYVLTYILSKGERIKVLYKLYQKKGTWKVYDFEIEGVSIVKSYGSQYSEFLREGSFEQLLAKMRDKIEASKKKDAERSKDPKKTEKATPEREQNT